jgi:hypothetical protein
LIRGTEGVLAGEQDDIGWLVGDLGERDRQAADGQRGDRQQQPRLPGDDLGRPACALDDGDGDRGGGEREHDGPAELRGGEGGNAGSVKGLSA